MITVKQAKQLVAATTLPEQTALLPLADAHGLVLAADVFASIDIPAYPQSSMDGYAIRFGENDKKLLIAGAMKAGESFQQKLGIGQAIRIFTGAPVPEGADTVIMQEKVELSNDHIICRDEKITLGQHVRPKGAEVEAGKMAMPAGTPLSAAALGFLAGIGCEEVSVHIPPAVAIILTGDELQQPGKLLQFGQVYDANTIQLRAALEKAGIRSISVLYAADTPESVANALTEAMIHHQLVLVTGGVSVGDYDHVVDAANTLGAETIFHKIKQKPGKPLFFGKKDQTIVFGLPGNPSSALTCFYEYTLLLLDRWMRRPSTVHPLIATTTHAYSKPAGLTHFIKASYTNGKVTPLHAQESFRLHSFAQANCFMVLDEETDGCKANDMVTVHVLPI